MLARVVEESRGVVTIASIEGEVDASNVGAVGDRLRSALTNRSMALVVDLSGTSYLDSAGIHVLFALAADLRERQQQLHLAVPDEAPIRRAITITGLDVAVPTHPTRAAALAAATPERPA